MKRIELKNPDGASFQILPDIGGQWIDLRLLPEARTHLSPFPVVYGFEEGENFFLSGCYSLFPWVNRLNPNPFLDSSFPRDWKGLKQDSNGISIHGLFHSLPRKVLLATSKSLSMTPLIPKELPERFHFFEILETYSLERDSLKLEVEVTNRGTRTEFVGMGYHPYFRLGTDIEDCILKFPEPTKAWKLGEDHLPLPEGPGKEFTEEASFIFLKNKHLDDLFLTKSVSFVSPKLGLGLKISCLDTPYLVEEASLMQYFQIFTHPNRKSIAIEPMTATGNFVHLRKSGGFVLEPGRKFRTGFEVRLVEKN